MFPNIHASFPNFIPQTTSPLKEQTPEKETEEPIELQPLTASNALEAVFQSLNFSAMARENAVREKESSACYKRDLDQKLAPIIRIKSSLTKKREDGRMIPHPNLLNNHQKLSPAQLFHACWKDDILPNLPPDTDKEYVKAQLYVHLLELLDMENRFLIVLKDYIECLHQCRATEKILFESSPVKFVGNMFFITVPRWDLSTTEGFACFLRFTKRIEYSKFVLSDQEKKVFDKLVKKGDKSVLAQTSFFTVKARQSENQEKREHLESDLRHSLGQACGLVTLQYDNALFKRITPALALLLNLFIDHLKETSEKGNYDPKADPVFDHFLPAYDNFMKQLLNTGYVEKQAALYKITDENLRFFLKKNPNDLTQAAFTKLESLKTSEQFALAQNPLKPKTTKSPLALTPPLNDAKPSIPKEKSKFGKKKRRPKGSHSELDESNPLQLPSDPKQEAAQAVVACPMKPEVSLAKTLAQALQQPQPVIWHRRVKRWINLSPNRIEEIRSFTDRRENTVVQLYANLPLEELLGQFLMHSFSPLIDKLLGEKGLKDKYTFQTATGHAIFIEIIKPGSPAKKGVIRYGIDGKLCYHRKIDLKSDEEFNKLSFLQLADDSLLNRETSEEEMQAALSELSSEFEGDYAEFDEELEILRFIDRKNGCQINVFPLK